MDDRSLPTGRRGVRAALTILALTLALLLLGQAAWQASPSNAASGTPEVLELAPAMSEPSTTVPLTFFANSVTVTYTGGPAWVSGAPYAATPLAADDAARLTVRRPDGTTWTQYYESYTSDFGPIDLSEVLSEGDNTVTLALVDLVAPQRGGGWFYLIAGEDTIPPVIENVRPRQDYAGQFQVIATITDNVAVAAASLWWKGQEYPMSPWQGDDYFAIVPQQLNGEKGTWHITAVDPSGNLAVYPADGEQTTRILYQQWAAKMRNTALAGEPVNTATGHFFTAHRDFAGLDPNFPLPAAASTTREIVLQHTAGAANPPVSSGAATDAAAAAPGGFMRTYSSGNSTIDGPFGWGWSHSFNVRLTEYNEPMLIGAELRYEDGRVAVFSASGEGFASPPGDPNVLSRAGDGYELIQPNGVVRAFDSSGKLTSVRDRFGNVLSLSYTGNDLTAVRDAVGRVYTFQVLGGHIHRIVDPIGRQHRYAYADGELVSYTDPGGGVIRYEYGDEHWLTGIVDANGHRFIRNTYDARGRVTEQRDAAGSTAEFTYVDEHTVVFSDYESNPTTYRYDSRLRLVQLTDALGHSEFSAYNDQDQRVSFTDKGGHTTRFTFNPLGQVVERINARGDAAVWQFNAISELVYHRDESGAETRFEYGPSGLLQRIVNAEGGDQRFEHDARGLLTLLRNEDGVEVRFRHDSEANLAEMTGPGDRHVIDDFDRVGRRIATTDGAGSTTRFEWDACDRLTATIDPSGNATRFLYDPVGNLLRTEDRRGFVVSNEYDVNDSLIGVTNKRGFVTRMTYDRQYNRLSVQDPRGAITRFGYTPLYQLAYVENAKGQRESYQYDNDGNRVRVLDVGGGETVLGHDDPHRLVFRRDALGNETHTVLDALGRVTEVRDARGGISRWTRDRLGRVLSEQNALGHTTTKTWSPAGLLLTLTNGNGHATFYSYSDAGDLTEVRTALDHVERMTHDAAGRLVARVDARGARTEYHLDGNDQVVEVVDALGGVVRNTWDAEGNLLTVTNQNGETTSYVYDEEGNRLGETLPLGQSTLYSFDPNRNLIAQRNAKGNTWRWEYDSLNAKTAEVDPLGARIEFSYTPLGGLASSKDKNGNTTVYLRDALDRLTGVVDALGGRTKYEWDALSFLTAQTDPSGSRTTFEVDAIGQRTRETDPLGKNWLYRWDGAGNLIERLDAAGSRTRYLFDLEERATGIDYPTGVDVALSLDANGNPVQVVDGSGSLDLQYDLLGRLIEAQRGTGILAGKSVRYAYDATGRRLSVSYPDGKQVRYGWDANGWLAWMMDPLGGRETYSRDGVGLLLRSTSANGTWTEQSWDVVDRLVRVYNGKPGASTTLVSSYDFTLDPVGNRIRTVERVTRGQIVTWDKVHVYDALHRLTEATYTPDTRPLQVYRSTYEYNAAGDRVREMSNIQDAPNTPPAPKMVETRYVYNAAHQMLSAGGTVFEYDANGDRIGMQGPSRAARYTYDAEGQMVTAETFDVLPNKRLKADASLSFVYDAWGRQVQRAIVEKGARKVSDYLYDARSFDLLAQYVDPGSPRTTFYYRDPSKIVSRHEIQGDGQGLQYWYAWDGIGSVSAWTNQAGQATQEYSYAPFGRLMDNNGPDNASNQTGPHNQLAFNGKLWDRELEQYYYGVRYYDPGTGVWTTPDDYRGRLSDPVTLQRYQFSRNNPVNVRDAVGYDTVWPLPSFTSQEAASSARLQTLQSNYAKSPMVKSSNGGSYSISQLVIRQLKSAGREGLLLLHAGAGDYLGVTWLPVLMYSDRIEEAAARYGLDARLIGAIILHEQRHRWLEPLVPGDHDSVGLGQIRVSVWGPRLEYSREQLERPGSSIEGIARILAYERETMKMQGLEVSNEALATRYNCSSIDRCQSQPVSDYGREVAIQMNAWPVTELK